MQAFLNAYNKRFMLQKKKTKTRKQKQHTIKRDAVIFLNKDAQDICIDFRVINVFIITRQL